MERSLQMKGRLGELIGGTNVVLMLNEPEFIFLFIEIDPLITNYGNIPRFQ